MTGDFAHANDGHREESKGHKGHQENIQLLETEGNLRLGFPMRCPAAEDGVSGAGFSAGRAGGFCWILRGALVPRNPSP